MLGYVLRLLVGGGRDYLVVVIRCLCALLVVQDSTPLERGSRMYIIRDDN